MVIAPLLGRVQNAPVHDVQSVARQSVDHRFSDPRTIPDQRNTPNILQLIRETGRGRIPEIFFIQANAQARTVPVVRFFHRNLRQHFIGPAKLNGKLSVDLLDLDLCIERQIPNLITLSVYRPGHSLSNSNDPEASDILNQPPGFNPIKASDTASLSWPVIRPDSFS